MGAAMNVLWLHAARWSISGSIAVAGALSGHFVVAAAGSFGLFLSAFALAHDAMHGALGLSRKGHDAVLAFAGLFLLQSGHAMRRMHLRHHARPEAADDVEGRGAVVGPFCGLVLGAAQLVSYRLEAWRAGRARDRRWQLGEHVASIALALALVLSGAWVYAAVAFALQLSMPVWASWVPHRAPAWVRRAAAKLAFSHSVMMVNLAYHELHHRRPSVPCDALPSMA